MVSGHLQEKKGYYYMVINLTDENGRRKPKWISTGLPVKGNKRRAEAMLQEERAKYERRVFVKDERMQFSDYMLYWLNLIKSDVEIDTYAGYQSNVENALYHILRNETSHLVI